MSGAVKRKGKWERSGEAEKIAGGWYCDLKIDFSFLHVMVVFDDSR